MSKSLGVVGVALLFGVVGCSKHSGSTSGTVAGLVADSAGEPIAGVQVKSGTATTLTASDGSYQLTVMMTSSVIVSFSKTSYLDTANSVPALAGDTTTLDVTLFTAAAPQNLDATAGGTVTGARGSSLTAGPGSFVTQSGAAVSGQVEVSLTPLDPTKPAEFAAYPGQLLGTIDGGPPQPLRTFGVLDVTVTQSGQRLQIAPGKTVTVTIPAAASDALPTTEDLWSYNLSAAVWSHEGKAQRKGTVYTAQLPHLSFWNIDSPDQINNACCIQGKVKDASGKGVAGAQVIAIGLSVSGEGDAAYTDGSGHYCTWVPSYSVVEVTAKERANGKQTQGSLDAMSMAAQPYVPVCQSAGQCQTLPDIVLADHGDGGVSGDGGSNDVGTCSGLMGGMDGGVADGGSATAGPPLSATCAAPLATFFNCFSPSGACSIGMAMGSSFEVDFANGSKEKWTTAGSVSTAQLYGPNGTYCGSEMNDSGSMSLDILPSGASVPWIVTKSSIVCPDGTTIMLSPAQSSALAGCVGAGAGSTCDTSGKTCSSNSDCPTSGQLMQTCCMANAGNVCLSSSICPTYQSMGCSAAAPCVVGDQCCPLQGTGISICFPASAPCPM